MSRESIFLEPRVVAGVGFQESQETRIRRGQIVYVVKANADSPTVDRVVRTVVRRCGPITAQGRLGTDLASDNEGRLTIAVAVLAQREMPEAMVEVFRDDRDQTMLSVRGRGLKLQTLEKRMAAVERVANRAANRSR